MALYSGIKLLHIVSATILFGTGLGTAFFMLRAYLSGDRKVMTATADTVVLADWLFTTPAVVAQLLTGLWLTKQLGIPWTSVWFVVVISLFVFVGACWLPVVWIQIRLRNRLSRGGGIDECRSLMRLWIAFGVAAFSAVLVLLSLMVYRPWIQHTAFGM